MSTAIVQSLTCAGMVVVCVCVSLAYYIFDKMRKKTVNLIVSDTSCNLLFIAMSLSAINIGPFIGQISTHNSGMAALLIIIGHFLASMISALFVIPVLYAHKFSTIHQIFLKRFRSQWFQCLAAVWNIITTLLLCVVAYFPCKMLSVLSGVPFWTTLLASLLLCIGILSLGGVRGVIHCEAVFYIFMFLGFIYLLIISLIYDSKENLEKWEESNSKMAVILQVVFSAVLQLIIIHSSFTVTTADQWVVVFDRDTVRSKPSLAFLYSLLLAAVLSSLSPLLLSINTVMYEDIIIPRAKRWAERNYSWLTRLTAALFAGLFFCFGLMMSYLPPQTRRLMRPYVATIAYCLDGPLALAVLTSLVLPIVNTKGILSALIIVTMAILGFNFSGQFLTDEYSVNQAWNETIYNLTAYDPANSHNGESSNSRRQSLGSVNPDFVSFIAMASFIVISVAVSSITGGLRHNRGGVNTLLSHSCVKGNNETLGTEFMPWSHAGDSNRPIRRASESAATTRPHKVNGRRAYYQSQKTVTSQSLF